MTPENFPAAPSPVQNFADAPAGLVIDRKEKQFSWRIPVCVYCGLKHHHGAGLFGQDPRSFLGYRVAHCFAAPESRSYRLVDANPQRTAQLVGSVNVDDL
jgi:hypothetical protein